VEQCLMQLVEQAAALPEHSSPSEEERVREPKRPIWGYCRTRAGAASGGA
jgi:hypothetical protein